MHNLKEIRENLEHFKTSLSHRNSEVDYDQILDLDKKNRKLIQEKEKFEMEKKISLNQKMNLYLKNLKKYPRKLKIYQKNKKLLIMNLIIY